MRRDPHDEPPRHRHRHRPPKRVSTLGEMQQTDGKWCWLYCNNLICNHSAPVAIAPFVIRWGPDASSDVLRRSARCSKCGHKGATTVKASWVDTEVGFQPFPVARPTDRQF
jgi:hypothetical protein